MKHQHDSGNINGVESTFSTFQAWRQDTRYLVFEGISYYQALQTLTFVYHNMDTEINSSKYDFFKLINSICIRECLTLSSKCKIEIWKKAL